MKVQIHRQLAISTLVGSCMACSSYSATIVKVVLDAGVDSTVPLDSGGATGNTGVGGTGGAGGLNAAGDTALIGGASSTVVTMNGGLPSTGATNASAGGGAGTVSWGSGLSGGVSPIGGAFATGGNGGFFSAGGTNSALGGVAGTLSGTSSLAGGASQTGGAPASSGNGGLALNGGTSNATGGTAGSAGGLAATGGCGQLTTDAKNCGSCGHSCLGGLCSNGICQPSELCAGLTSPSALAIAADFVYVCDGSGKGSVKRLDKKGVLPPASLASGLVTTDAVALAGNRLYFGSADFVYGMDISNASSTAVIPATAPVYALSVDGANVYWLETGTSSSVMWSVAADGSTATTPMGIVDARLVNFGVADQCIYIYTNSTGTLNAGLYKSCGSELTSIYPVGNRVTFSGDHVSDGTWLYFREASRGIMRMPLNGAANPTLVAASPAGYGPIVDENYVYYIEGEAPAMACGASWSIWRAKKDGKTGSQVLASNLTCALSLTMDDDSLYWSNNVDGIVMRLAK